MVLGPRGPGRVGRRRFFIRGRPFGAASSSFRSASLDSRPHVHSRDRPDRRRRASCSSRCPRLPRRPGADRRQAGSWDRSTCAPPTPRSRRPRLRPRLAARADGEAARAALVRVAPGWSTRTSTSSWWTTARASTRTALTSWRSASGGDEARVVLAAPGRPLGRREHRRVVAPLAAARFVPETELERRCRDPVLREGLAWGKPRRGHPEGASARTWPTCSRRSSAGARPASAARELRFLALVHDSLKYRVQHWLPQHRREPPRHARAPLRRALHRRRAPARDDRAARPPVRPVAQVRAPRPRSTSTPSTRWSTACPTSTCSCASWSSTARPRARTTSRSAG